MFLIVFSAIFQALMDMFYQDEGGNNSGSAGGSISAINDTHNIIVSVGAGGSGAAVAGAPRNSLTYEEVVRELMASERQYLRELHMIIKVFR